ncbi:hypothetical protein ANTPLA_LOCUS591 [Anthophora plagiata]
MLGHVEPLHIASIINCIPQCYHLSLSRGPLKAMKRSNVEAREGRTRTVLKPENQLPITPLRKALTPRVRPTEYNRSYSVVL